jgi:hypothetical protein
MAETQREPVPRVDSGELDTALAFLSFARHCVLKKADGLSDEQLRRVLVDSGTSVLGLVQHLAEAERYWFGYHLVGAAWDADREHGMAVSANRAVADVLRTTGRHSRTATARSVPSAIRKRVSSSRSTATGTRSGGSWPT